VPVRFANIHDKIQESKSNDEIKIGISYKVVWYLLIIPCLNPLFANPREEKLIHWHQDGWNNDKMLRHPADAPQ
jgi:hypothetical protein